MYNKRIVDADSLNKELSVVFYNPYLVASDIDKSAKGQKLRILNPDINTEYVVIGGCGVTGETVYKILSDSGMQVQCFVDSNEKLAGMMKCGLPVYTLDRLGKLTENVTIVEAMEKWKSFDESIREICENRFHYSLESNNFRNGITYMDEGVRKSIFSLANFWMFNLFVDKKVYIYGNSNIEKEFAKYLKLMDFDFAGFLVDTEVEENNIEQYPFAFGYAKLLFDYARERIENDFIDEDENHVCTGIMTSQNIFNNWLSNIRTMYAIASERKIRFFSFCQPCLSSKEEKTIKEKNILISMQSHRGRKLVKESFRKYMALTPELPDYIYDLSNVFDGENDIYMDICHVWEKGNQIIAREIKKIILSEINLDNRQKGMSMKDGYKRS
ncbi:MAG: hypothetical protein HDR03_11130 [Lachnospiraceae bacterium]|nr:hypothetical protein [Lachnospiraceae bacterium]